MVPLEVLWYSEGAASLSRKRLTEPGGPSGPLAALTGRSRPERAAKLEAAGGKRW